MPEEEIECTNCQWRGKWDDTIHCFERMEDYCPKCHKKDLIDLDGVTEQDLIDQNPIERPNG